MGPMRVNVLRLRCARDVSSEHKNSAGLGQEETSTNRNPKLESGLQTEQFNIHCTPK
jgi:hypothetical protein